MKSTIIISRCGVQEHCSKHVHRLKVDVFTSERAYIDTVHVYNRIPIQACETIINGVHSAVSIGTKQQNNSQLKATPSNTKRVFFVCMFGVS